MPFQKGQRIVARRSGRAESLAEILEARLSEIAQGVYRVRWEDGLETYFVPGPDAHDRRTRDDGPPAGTPERRHPARASSKGA